MINQSLLNPGSIVVIGGSDDVSKPGGKVLKNLIEGKFRGDLYVVNPRSGNVQGVKTFPDPDQLPSVDLAILAVAAKFCPPVIGVLAEKKNTRAFIVLSAGFGEENEEGKKLEQEMLETVNRYGACLIGPNCIGFLNHRYSGVFTTPIPPLDPMGFDFISGSGATAVFIMESAIPRGLSFSSVYSVGNSVQVGVEDVLRYMDEHFDPVSSSKLKLLYIESVTKPALLLKHASSLISKGCRIAAIKAGYSEAGSRAASSHTGALASPDTAVEALLAKAGIVRCHSRDELVAVGSVFMHKELSGRRLAVISHAGGPAVMMTDSLSTAGFEVPPISGPAAALLLEKLHPGSSVSNPIDFLATGTAGQLDAIIDACEHDFNEVDGMAVIFGSPGLVPVDDVYDVISRRMDSCTKPVFPVLPSVINAAGEINGFLQKGRVFFQDEVVFARALSRVYNTPKPAIETELDGSLDHYLIREIISRSGEGYMSPGHASELLSAAGIRCVEERTVTNREDAANEAGKLGYPVVMKVIGPVHKSDLGGVILDVRDGQAVLSHWDRLMRIEGAKGVLIQKMHRGLELFTGIKAEPPFGHLLMCGLGGIFIEVMKDVKSALVPVGKEEAERMIRGLRGYGLLEGRRGQPGVNIEKFIDILIRVSSLAAIAPEIRELDLNPLLGLGEEIVAVDARIFLNK